jgi:single-stranded-DNA-specific exonuclease
LGNSQRALELLLAPDRATADRLAADLDDLNHKRQRIQEVIWAEAVRAAELCQDDPALVLGAEGWHQGVVGIVAAKLVEKYRKPTIVVGFAEGQGRGSARTLSGFNLYTALAECRAYLTGFGGHAVAAGVSLQAENLAAFRTAFLSVAQSFFATAVPQAVVDVDAIATLSELDLAQADELARLGPFGNANSDPCIVVPGLVVRNTRVVGGSHLQLTLTDGRTVSEAIAFGMADQDPGQGARLDVVGTAEVDSFRGQRRIRLRLRHLLRSTSCT